ncbi:MAG: lipase family alpha/beta hydrolase [Agathobaculum sp.]|jgi:triacylglycerol lipase|uniref:lipase family alpha/beta hydrolase n=1 Tax=Agathobaculum sp. TaxID=2048138 RepID=UPI003D919F1D
MLTRSCKTRYPIVLAHGLAVREGSGRGSYEPWGRVPAALRAHGAQVFLGGQDAWGSIESCAAQLACTVRRAMEQTGARRVNIIAHSKGGLEARYLISSMGWGRYVASLSMLSTPNRGSRVAETLLYARQGVALWAKGNDAYWRRHGDAAPDSLRAGEQLTPAYLAAFNRHNPDAACVYYQSWGACLGSARTDGAMMLTRGLFYPLHGESDGLVTPDSARWGVYRGTLAGVSHQQLVDAFRRDVPGLAPRRFYIHLVRELKENGF